MAEQVFQAGLINYDGGIASHHAAARVFSPETAGTWTGDVGILRVHCPPVS